jgi:hypothetical protein
MRCTPTGISKVLKEAEGLEMDYRGIHLLCWHCEYTVDHIASSQVQQGLELTALSTVRSCHGSLRSRKKMGCLSGST